MSTFTWLYDSALGTCEAETPVGTYRCVSVDGGSALFLDSAELYRAASHKDCRSFAKRHYVLVKNGTPFNWNGSMYYVDREGNLYCRDKMIHVSQTKNSRLQRAALAALDGDGAR